ncbi:MAG: FUN14 domain-containing protein [Candidatus Nitrosopolaris sp.]
MPSFILNLSQKIRSEENNTSNEVLLSNMNPFAGSGLVGYAIGFALKKILKWILIIVGFLAGIFFLGVQLLQRYGYVSTVNWDYLP